jgi:hypothetical protein
VHPLLEDPWVARRIDDAVAPYVGRLSDEEIAWMRDELAETLATDPGAAAMLHRARPTTVDESGEVRRDGVAGDLAGHAVRTGGKAAG